MALRMALAQRMKADLISASQERQAAARSQDFSSLDDRLAQVEAVRERNQRAEREAAARVRRVRV